MQMHPDHSERALELLYGAMRARDAAPAGSPAWHSADEQARAIREAYLRVSAGEAALAGEDDRFDDDGYDEPAEGFLPAR